MLQLFQQFIVSQLHYYFFFTLLHIIIRMQKLHQSSLSFPLHFLQSQQLIFYVLQCLMMVYISGLQYFWSNQSHLLLALSFLLSLVKQSQSFVISQSLMQKMQNEQDASKQHMNLELSFQILQETIFNQFQAVENQKVGTFFYALGSFYYSYYQRLSLLIAGGKRIDYLVEFDQGEYGLWTFYGYTIKIYYYLDLFIIISQKMNNSSKKNTTVHVKNQSQHSKGLKRSKSTEQILPKKVVKKIERAPSNEVKHTLVKSKSTKSLKSKPKQVSIGSECSNKKSKGKKSETKTVKKVIHRQVNELSFIQSQDWQAKKPVLEYFIYHNNYIPIENSAQRRFVYKIQMIDLENNSTATTFYNKKQDVSIATQTKQCKDIAIGQQIALSSQQIQTEKCKYVQIPQKCFVSVLTQLEFFYLPNQDSFAPFTQNQRVHYGQLLETLAKKMLGENKAVAIQACLTVDQLTVLLYQRQGIQVGALDFVPLQGFPTHLLSILAYLKNLFCFLQYGFKQQVLTSLRLFYGLNYNQRIKRLSRRLPHEKDVRIVLDQQIFQTFENQMFKDYQFSSELTKQAVHYHNKAIFDAVNDQLQAFRPFYTSQGEPFPWTNNLGMTHYDITEEALYIIFVQIKQKIQKYSITLCGMYTDFDDESLPRPHNSSFYKKKMEERQEKMVQQEIKAIDDKVALDYEVSSFYFELANQIFFEMVNELESELNAIIEKESLEDHFQFQYFN